MGRSEARTERRLGILFHRRTYQFDQIAQFIEVKSERGSRLGIQAATGDVRFLTLSTEYSSLKEQTAMANRVIRHRRWG